MVLAAFAPGDKPPALGITRVGRICEPKLNIDVTRITAGRRRESDTPLRSGQGPGPARPLYGLALAETCGPVLDGLRRQAPMWRIEGCQRH